MSFATLFRQKYIAWKYKYYELKLVQDIPTERFNEIIEIYKVQGWELTDAHSGDKSGIAYRRCKLRKGSSILNCAWNDSTGASIVGPSRIINGLGKEFELTVLSSPK